MAVQFVNRKCEYAAFAEFGNPARLNRKQHRKLNPPTNLPESSAKFPSRYSKISPLPILFRGIDGTLVSKKILIDFRHVIDLRDLDPDIVSYH
jgi:hypothetical protein